MPTQKPLRTVQLGKGTLNCVAWSPDRSRLALGRDDHTVYVFTPTGELHWRRKKHTAPIETLAWSPDGRFLASGADDGTLRIWSLDGTDIRCIEGHEGFIASVVWSPDGLRLASGSEDRTLRIWSATEGTELRRLEGHHSTLWAVAWSPNGDSLASGSGDRCVCVWSTTGGALLQTLTGHTHAILQVAWSPDSTRLASCAKDRTVRIWHASTSTVQHAAEYEDPIMSMAWSPTGQFLALGSSRGVVHLWSPGVVPAQTFQAHTQSISGVAWSPDGSNLSAVARDGLLAIWEIETTKDFRTKPPQPAPNALDWIARQAATVGRRPPPWVPHLPRISTDQPLEALGVLRAEGTQTAGAPCVAIAPDDLRLVSGHMEGHLRCWDLLDGRLIWTTLGRRAQDIAWAPDGKHLAMGAEDGALSLCSASDGIELHRFPGHRAPVSSVAWSPDGRALASGSADRTIRVWVMDEDGVGLRGLHCLHGHRDRVLSVAWSPDARHLVSGSEDGTVRVWSVSDGQERRRLEGHTEAVYSVAWSSRSDWIASGSQDNTIRLWSTKGQEQHSLSVHGGAVLRVAWSPEGGRLAAGSMDGTVRVWDLPGVLEGRSSTRCFASSGYAWRVAWASSGHFLVSGHAEDTLQLWDTRSPPLRRTHKNIDAFESRGFASLPAALVALHREGIYPPLSWVHDLRCLLGGGSPLSLRALTSEPEVSGIRSLQALGWSSGACTGLIAWLLRDLSGTEAWRVPTELSPTTVRALLATALSGDRIDRIEPRIPSVPLDMLRAALQRVDNRALTLIESLGADATLAEPGLISKVFQLDPSGIALSPVQRRLLHYPLTPLPVGETLEIPRLRPTVIILDGSPMCHGAVLDMLRTAAHAVVTTLRRAGLSVVLVGAGGPPTVHPLTHPLARIVLLTLVRDTPADTLETVAIATQLQRQCVNPTPTVEPIVLLLTHPQWGSGGSDCVPPPIPRLRALFVDEKPCTALPPWAKYCERVSTLASDQYAHLPEALGRLMG